MSNLHDQYRHQQQLEEDFWDRPVGADALNVGDRGLFGWGFSRLMFVAMLVLVGLIGLLTVWLYQRQPPEQSLIVKPYAQAIKQVPLESTATAETESLPVLELHNPKADERRQQGAADVPQVVLPAVLPVIDDTRVPSLSASDGLAERLLDGVQAEPSAAALVAPVVELVPPAPTRRSLTTRLPTTAAAQNTSNTTLSAADEVKTAALESEILADTPKAIDPSARAETQQRLIQKIQESQRQDALKTSTFDTPPPAQETPSSTAVASMPAIQVQIASLRQQADAAEIARRLFLQHGTLLDNFQTSIRQVDLAEEGTYHRVYVEGFSSLVQANDWCRQWQKIVGDCLVIDQ